MRLRQLLIVYSSQHTLNEIKQPILSELCDVVLTETVSGREALEYFQKKPFDAVIVDTNLSDLSGPDLYQKMQEAKPNEKIPFILLAPVSEVTSDFIDELCLVGIEHYLAVPFTTKAMIGKIKSVCNPRLWRVDDRFHIPTARASLHLGSQDVEIELINISQGGIFCEFINDAYPIDLLGIISMSMVIPATEGDLQIRDIKCTLSRLNVISRKSGGVAEHIRMTLLFSGLSSQQEEQLAQLVDMARKMNFLDKRGLE
ncbi:MAG: response regulator [Deltaproteobacteria bacterium]|nr:response regulator [Deltaproteobacteria bacterium]